VSRLVKIRRTVRSRLGIPVTDQFQTDDMIDEHINIAIQTIEQEFRWPWQEAIQNITIADTTGDVSVPTAWKATRTVICQLEEVAVVPPVEVLMRPTTDTGIPTIFTVIDRTLKFRPVPPVGTTLQHVYYRTPDLLVDDDDEPQMPTEYTPAIVAKAAELLSLRDGDRAAAGAHLAEYQQWLQRMRKDIRRTTGPITPRIRPGAWT
jgi:hypothetical protein